MDRKSFAAGFLCGLMGKGVLRGAEPVAYLYNGVQLPKLPEWDREKYPYAWIIEESLTILGEPYHHYYLECCSELPKRYVLGGNFKVDGSGTKLVSTFRAIIRESHGGGSDTAWGEFAEQSYNSVVATSSFPPFWSNFDILNSDGTVYLAASDPIPVYE